MNKKNILCIIVSIFLTIQTTDAETLPLLVNVSDVRYSDLNDLEKTMCRAFTNVHHYQIINIKIGTFNSKINDYLDQKKKFEIELPFISSQRGHLEYPFAVQRPVTFFQVDRIVNRGHGSKTDSKGKKIITGLRYILFGSAKGTTNKVKIELDRGTSAGSLTAFANNGNKDIYILCSDSISKRCLFVEYLIPNRKK